MRIKKLISQNKRDFYADMECQHCGNVQANVPGYDDRNFHSEVIPKMKCVKCGKIAPEDYVPLGTKYPDNQIV